MSAADAFRPFATGIAFLKAIHNAYPKQFEWKQPPYEYEEVKLPIDILAGTDRLRKDIEAWKYLKEMELGGRKSSGRLREQERNSFSTDSDRRPFGRDRVAERTHQNSHPAWTPSL